MVKKSPIKTIKIDPNFFKLAHKYRGLDYREYKKAIIKDLKKKR